MPLIAEPRREDFLNPYMYESNCTILRNNKMIAERNTLLEGSWRVIKKLLIADL